MERAVLTLDSAPPGELVQRIVRGVGEMAKSGMAVAVPFDRLLEMADLPPTRWWSWDTAANLRVPLGPTGARKPQFMVLGEGWPITCSWSGSRVRARAI